MGSHYLFRYDLNAAVVFVVGVFGVEQLAFSASQGHDTPRTDVFFSGQEIHHRLCPPFGQRLVRGRASSGIGVADNLKAFCQQLMVFQDLGEILQKFLRLFGQHGAPKLKVDPQRHARPSLLANLCAEAPRCRGR